MSRSDKKPSRPADHAEEPTVPPRNWWRENLEAFLVAVLFALFVRTYVAEAFQIPTSSMEENLLIGDHLVVNKFLFSNDVETLMPSREIRRFDVVIFKAPQSPEEDYVKRVIGMPGDTIAVRGQRVFVNGQVLDETGAQGYRAWWKQGGILDFPRYQVPPGHYFVMGDNRDFSEDSRVWGPVPRESIRGRPLFIYWSYESERNPHIGTLSQRVGRIADRVLRFFTKTRWERTFQPIR